MIHLTVSGEMISFIIEFIGTVAFALSGAVVAIKKRMDIFGVIILALSTAIGGGIMRDLIVGNTPPNSFQHPFFGVVAIVVSIIIFYYVAYHERKVKKLDLDQLIDYLNFFDAIGLGAFTVNGIAVAYEAGYTSIFLLLTTGALTGVGGGVIRDILADTMPFILTRHIYALASLVGGLVCIILAEYCHLRLSIAMIIGAVVVVSLRMIAVKYKWNLPRIDY